jgi:hypothetical protein
MFVQMHAFIPSDLMPSLSMHPNGSYFSFQSSSHVTLGIDFSSSRFSSVICHSNGLLPDQPCLRPKLSRWQYSATLYLLLFASITRTPSIIQINVILARISDPTRSANCHAAKVQPVLLPIIWSTSLHSDRESTWYFLPSGYTS